jgi:hypothetical protein
MLKNESSIPNGLKLLHRYCTEAPVDFEKYGVNDSANRWAGRFKVIGRADHIEDYNLPNFITSYNSTPVLIRTTGTLMRYFFRLLLLCPCLGSPFNRFSFFISFCLNLFFFLSLFVSSENYLEMDINTYSWGNVTRQALQILSKQIDKMAASMGFCIESLSDEEMPENLFGCGRIIKLDFTKATNWDEL